MGTAALADLTGTTSQPSRRARAAKTVDGALRGGILVGAVAAIAWLVASAVGSIIYLLLIIATVLALVYTVARGDKARLMVWAVVGVAWVLVLAERWAVKDHGGLIVAAASYVGVVLGARKAGIAKKSLVLLLYPLISVAICLGADTSVTDPWGVSWLWVAAILGPVVGARTLLNPSPRDHKPKSAEQPL
ncbi:hypothetical protein OM076_36700 [Solirubrobacter ginsenosidimutans]|uniref:Uncharacterized protein n=1 Tax=Solirubrobacter ginsenosidimutans TaxID=490573 RepID=A0A9X3N6Q1_9ACTN|nr:hypothetical protein [Solirubrobacter ginsenosidimutans]MDA0165863.1 hypothetical protein [Solirubrobacter ginsenosidimutans]